MKNTIIKPIRYGTTFLAILSMGIPVIEDATKRLMSTQNKLEHLKHSKHNSFLIFHHNFTLGYNRVHIQVFI